VILSRTSRIMIGFLLLALAAFLWVNFLVRDSGFDLGFLRAAGGDLGGAPEAQAPAVAPVPESQVARELEILDLPFLVTEPPVRAESPEGAPAQAEAAPGQAARRATVNPFSPVIQSGGARAAAQPTGQRQGAAQNNVTNVPVPGQPAGGAQAAAGPRAPAPAPVTPSGQASGTLPRALPGGTLGTTPPLLREAIGATDVPAGNAGRMAAVREPERPATELQQAGVAGPAAGEPQPLERPISPQAQARPGGQPPLAAGTSTLSRYLRDNNVRFTGSVIGPVSVGVFRSSLTSAPVVISLGQALPDTSIVLTDLRGQQAELTLGDSKQTLTLELRR
jgi:hypothetical protein